MDVNGNYYEILGVDATDFKGKTEAEISKMLIKKFRAITKNIHPDMNPYITSPGIKMDALKQAHETLKDPDLREQYNRRLGINQDQQPPHQQDHQEQEQEPSQDHDPNFGPNQQYAEAEYARTGKYWGRCRDTNRIYEMHTRRGTSLPKLTSAEPIILLGDHGRTYLITDGLLIDTITKEKVELPTTIELVIGEPLYVYGLQVTEAIDSFGYRIDKSYTPDMGGLCKVTFGQDFNKEYELNKDKYHFSTRYAYNLLDGTQAVTETKPGTHAKFDNLKSYVNQSEALIVETESGNFYYLVDGHFVDNRTGKVTELPFGEQIDIKIGEPMRIRTPRGTLNTTAVKSITKPTQAKDSATPDLANPKLSISENPFEAARRVVMEHLTRPMSHNAGIGR